MLDYAAAAVERSLNINVYKNFKRAKSASVNIGEICEK